MAEVHGRYFEFTFGGTLLGKLRNLSDNSTTDSTETSNSDSGSHKEFIPNMSADTISLEVIYDPTNVAAQTVLASLRAKTTATCVIQPKVAVTGDRTYTASGFATSIGHAYPYKELVTRSIEIQVTGEPTISITP